MKRLLRVKVTKVKLCQPSVYFVLYFRAERSVKELKEKFLQGKIPDLVKTSVK